MIAITLVFHQQVKVTVKDMFMYVLTTELSKTFSKYTCILDNCFYRSVKHLPKFIQNKRPTGLNGHLSIRDFTLSKGLIFVYQQPHHRINENQLWYRKAAS